MPTEIFIHLRGAFAGTSKVSTSRLGVCRLNLESFFVCADARLPNWTSVCQRRIRLRHVATGADLVAGSVRVSSRLRSRVT